LLFNKKIKRAEKNERQFNNTLLMTTKVWERERERKISY